MGISRPNAWREVEMRSSELILRVGLSVTYGAIAAVGVVALGLITGFDLGRVSVDIEKQENYWQTIRTVFLGVSWVSYLLMSPDNPTSNRP